MNIDSIVSHPLINRSELAARMFPAMSRIGASQYLYKKLNAKERKTFSDKDKQKILKIIKDLFADIE
ncbi:MAG TPA: hypothetical protein VHA52_04500 [Candidatus Babeliaceae bacterium]|nr:hypothetical protein [Candidatus Babeliaceae bacterium]